MTEARSHSYTPFLIYVSPQADIEQIVTETLRTHFEENSNEEIIWINKEKESISIEAVRNLQQSLSYGSYQGSIRHVVLVALDTASLEAQNALLKLLEEPPRHTQLWLTTSNGGNILPTIISRCQEIVLSRTTPADVSRETEEVVSNIPSSSYRELSEIAEKYSDREDAETLINEVIFYTHQHLKSNTEQHRKILLQALQTQSYLEANVNVRLALENFFFTTKKILAE